MVDAELSDFDLPEVNPDVEIARILKDTEAFLNQHSPQRGMSSSGADQAHSKNKQLAHAEHPASPKSVPAAPLVSSQSKFTKVWMVLMVLVLVAAAVGIGYVVLTTGGGDDYGEW